MDNAIWQRVYKSSRSTRAIMPLPTALLFRAYEHVADAQLFKLLVEEHNTENKWRPVFILWRLY
jgi:hypothetical protein